MSALSLATVAGVPIGLLFAGWFGWHAPFFFVAGLAAPARLAAYRVLPEMDAHLRARTGPHVAFVRRPQAESRGPVNSVSTPV
jgi:predicted MFS family arabinose efflux permease